MKRSQQLETKSKIHCITYYNRNFNLWTDTPWTSLSQIINHHILVVKQCFMLHSIKCITFTVLFLSLLNIYNWTCNYLTVLSRITKGTDLYLWGNWGSSPTSSRTSTLLLSIALPSFSNMSSAAHNKMINYYLN